MKTRTKQFMIVLVIAALAVVAYSGTVFAQANSPSTPTNMLQWMQERLGPEAWAQRVEQMTKLHGAAFVSQHMERMAQQTSCPCTDGEGAGPGMGMRQGMMGQGMMQQQPNGAQQGMMGRDMRQGMTGQGMMQQQPNGTQQGMMGRGMRQGMMGQGMMQQQPNGTQQGMMGRGMQEHGRGFNQPTEPRFWNNTPDATPTPAQ